MRSNFSRLWSSFSYQKTAKLQPLNEPQLYIKDEKIIQVRAFMKIGLTSSHIFGQGLRVRPRAGTGSKFSGSGRARALRLGTGSGSGTPN